MKKFIVSLLIALMVIVPVSVSAKGVNTTGATFQSTGEVVDPEKWGDLDVTGFLSGTNQLVGSGIFWRGRYYETGFTGNQAVYFSTVILQEKVQNLENLVASLQAQVNSQQVNQNPVGGYPDTFNQPVQSMQTDLTPRVEALEKRVGYLEMALDYFNNWLVKVKAKVGMK